MYQQKRVPLCPRDNSSFHEKASEARDSEIFHGVDVRPTNTSRLNPLWLFFPNNKHEYSSTFTDSFSLEKSFNSQYPYFFKIFNSISRDHCAINNYMFLYKIKKKKIVSVNCHRGLKYSIRIKGPENYLFRSGKTFRLENYFAET